MHSFEAPSGATYYHNGDFSGDVLMDGNQLAIPFEDIRAIYLEYRRQRAIATLVSAEYFELEEKLTP